MKNYQIPGFDTIDLDDLSDYYNTEIDFKENKVQLDINFDEYSVDPQKLEAVAYFINDLGLFNDKAIAAMQEDYASGDIVKPYIKQHQELFNKSEQKEKLFAQDEDDITTQLSKLYLKRIGFYPENESQFAVFDYTINAEETQYLIVINFKRDGDTDCLTMES